MCSCIKFFVLKKLVLSQLLCLLVMIFYFSCLCVNNFNTLWIYWGRHLMGKSTLLYCFFRIVLTYFFVASTWRNNLTKWPPEPPMFSQILSAIPAQFVYQCMPLDIMIEAQAIPPPSWRSAAPLWLQVVSNGRLTFGFTKIWNTSSLYSHIIDELQPTKVKLCLTVEP